MDLKIHFDIPGVDSPTPEQIEWCPKPDSIIQLVDQRCFKSWVLHFPSRQFELEKDYFYVKLQWQDYYRDRHYPEEAKGCSIRIFLNYQDYPELDYRSHGHYHVSRDKERLYICMFNFEQDLNQFKPVNFIDVDAEGNLWHMGEDPTQGVYDLLKDPEDFNADYIVCRDKEGTSLRKYTYNTQCVYDSAWGNKELASRGLIIDVKERKVVAWPFEKFFNWGEAGRVLDENHHRPISIMKKMDGSLGIVYHYQGEWFVDTKGPFESKQALWAQEFIRTRCDMSQFDKEVTWLVEIISPASKVIVDYADQEKLVLLAGRSRVTGVYLRHEDLAFCEKAGMELVETFKTSKMSLEDVIEQCKVLDHQDEGFVVLFSNGQRFKFKSKQYLEVAKAIAGFSNKRLVDIYFSDVNDEEFCSKLPDEFQERADTILIYIESWVGSRIAKLYSLIEKVKDKTRKEQAEFFKMYHCLSEAFGLMAGKDISKHLKKAVLEKVNEEFPE